jgi:hypothetical protein
MKNQVPQQTAAGKLTGRRSPRLLWRSLTLSALSVATMSIALLFISASSASAQTPGPGWTLSSIAEPTNFSSGENLACEENPTGVPSASSPCDSYRVIARNVGSVSSSGPLAISDTLPPGVEAVYAVLREQQAGAAISEAPGCQLSPIRCEYSAPVAPGGELIMTVNLKVSSTVSQTEPTSGTNSATIEGGGVGQAITTGAPTTEPNTINGPRPPFAVTGFDFHVDGLDGTPDLQAADHPYGVTTSFNVPSFTQANFLESTYHHIPVQQIKDLVVDLPPGFIGDPQATPHCPLTALQENDNLTFTTNCPAASKVGTVTFDGVGIFHASNVVLSSTSGIFNMVPEDGYPAEFGFSYLGHSVFMYASVLPSSQGDGVRVTAPGLPSLPVQGVSLTFYGDPAVQDGGATPSAAFLTNPVDCAAPGPLKARIEADSWDEPARWVSAESTTYPQITGCDMLQFQPTLEVAPPTEETQADTPAGYEVDLKVPQAPNLSPFLAAPELKDATVTLPEGLSLSPGAADGLVGCRETGPEGINITHGWTPTGEEPIDGADPEATEIGADGLPHVAPGHCPAASQVGTVEVETPLLPAHTLTGRVYAAEPQCGSEGQPACTEASAANGELFGLYLEFEGEGTIFKLKGNVSANPSTGRLTTQFEEDPQLPFSELKLKLDGGPRAPLSNPQTCGTFTTASDLSPWSSPETPDAMPSSFFTVTGCGAGALFAPSFSAGTTIPIAGGFSPFTLTFSRHDGEQDLSGLTVNMPEGLLGKLAGIVECGEAEANAGTCPAASRVGAATAAAGAGSAPLWESGPVYLTGPYNGAPFGLAVVVPANAGPFHLGNIVVHAAIHINPTTAQVTVVSNPLPQMIDGVPLRVQTVNVTVGQEDNFTFNPTSCNQQSIGATISSVQGGAANVSSPFRAQGCANLPFKPSLTASAAGKASKAGGASLDVKVAPAAGQANIAKIDLELPKQLPARLTTLQKACVASVFEANPAACPSASAIGSAVVHTPVLNGPLAGPVYLVSHGGAAFPDVEIILQGEGVRIVADGKTQIKKGVTYSHFETVPDAPFTSFETKLPTGKYSIFGTNLPEKDKYNLCGQSLSMPITLAGQNGAVVKQTTKIGVTGCPKAKKTTKKKKKAGKARTSSRGKGRGH